MVSKRIQQRMTYIIFNEKGRKHGGSHNQLERDVLELLGRIWSFSLTCVTYQMDTAVHIVQEVDGVRIIGNETHELLQKVPGEK